MFGWMRSREPCRSCLGDLFDVDWKASQRNVAIYEDFLCRGGQTRHGVDRRWLILVVGFLLVSFVSGLVGETSAPSGTPLGFYLVPPLFRLRHPSCGGGYFPTLPILSKC